MRRVLPIILVGVAVLVLMDVVGALTGRPLGFPYPRLGVVSLLVYFGVGALAGSWLERRRVIRGVPRLGSKS